jgi:hypothetical protein
MNLNKSIKEKRRRAEVGREIRKSRGEHFDIGSV